MCTLARDFTKSSIVDEVSDKRKSHKIAIAVYMLKRPE